MDNKSSPIPCRFAWNPDRIPIPFVNPWGRSGAYTTMLVEGSPSIGFFIDRHLQRLRQSLDKLKLPHQFPETFLKDTILEFISGYNRGSFMLRTAVVSEGLILSTYPQIGKGAGLIGKPCRIRRNLPAAKSLQDMGLYKQMKNVDRSSEELLLVSQSGYILEGATTNVLFIRGNSILAPVQDALPGITRQVIQEQLPKPWLWNVDNVHLDELNQIDEILVCGSGKEVARIIGLCKLKWKPRSQKAFDALSRCYNDAKLLYLQENPPKYS